MRRITLAAPAHDRAEELRGGGRLLATHDAATILSTLGLEPDSPIVAPLPDPLPPEFGLAAFGPHPLSAGLRDGAETHSRHEVRSHLRG